MNSEVQVRQLFHRYGPSAWALVLANAAPLFGVIFLGWSAFDIVALYWAENVIIGLVNVLKIITCNTDLSQVDWLSFAPRDKVLEFRKQMEVSIGKDQAARISHATKLFIAPFFALHYGLFCFVHGVFILLMLGPGRMAGGPFDVVDEFLELAKANHLFWAIGGLAASHLFSFFYNYLGHGEYRRTVPILLMAQPYGRVVVLHIAILLGGFLAMALGNGTGLLVLLVVGKTILDLTMHFRERQRNESMSTNQLPDNVLTAGP